MCLKRGRLIAVGALALVISACASVPDRQAVTRPTGQSWSVSESLPKNERDLMRYCVEKTGGHWRRVDACDERQSNVEVLLLDPWNRRVFLGASAPSRKHLSVAEKERLRQGASPNSWECFYGALGTADRSKFGYTVCGSALTKGATGAGEAVIGNAFNVLFGTVKKRVAVDADAVLDAASQANLPLESYREVFANAKTFADFDKFIQRYRGDDPDGLVHKAAEAMQRAKQMETAEAAERERQLAIQRAEAAKRGQEYDKKRLEEERVRAAQAREREQKFNTWRRNAKVGDYCWVGPRQWGYDQAMMWALIVEIKGPLFRVQYDGQTNTHLFVALQQREEWVKNENVYPAAEYTIGSGRTLLKPNM